MVEAQRLEVIGDVVDETEELRYGSDLTVEVIRKLGIKFIALNPGASYRGLHDSIVNFRASDSENGNPEMIECTHEEIAVAVAHGYAKATGEPMAVGLHNVVGLQHASMAIFNAWCDREPMLLLGGGGPMDAELRRPTDWTHTALVQGNLVRDFVKWDDQPSSHRGVVESLLRASHIMTSEPKGPVYICLDGGLQERELSAAEQAMDIDFAGAAAGAPPGPDERALDRVAAAVRAAEWPVLLVGRSGDSEEAFATISRLANRWALPVLEAGGRLNIANTDPMNLSGADREVLQRADVIIALEVKDLVGTVSENDRTNRTTTSFLRPEVNVITIGVGDFVTRGFSTDYQALYPAELALLADPERALAQLEGLLGDAPATLGARREEITAWHDRMRATWSEQALADWGDDPIAWASMTEALRRVLEGEDYMFSNGDGHRAWVRRLIPMDKPRQSIGGSGGGGLGYGIGATIGAALANRDSGRIVVDLQSDGDFMMAPGALWTLARYKLPVLILMNNNHSYFNDEEHQFRLARARGRDENRAGIGTQITSPNISYAQLAESMGVKGFGPVKTCDELATVLAEALSLVKQGQPVLVDTFTQVRGGIS